VDKLLKYESYKPSGIEWIGEVPEHWEVKRLKDVADVNAKTLSGNTPADYELQYLDISNVDSTGLTGEITPYQFAEAPSRARRIIKDKDVIMSTVRPYLQAIAYIEKPPVNLIGSTGFAVLSAKRHFDSKYLYNQVTGHVFNSIVNAEAVGASYPAVNSNTFSTSKLLCPPLEEQEYIAQYLDQTRTKLQHIISHKQSQIERLKELRQIEINRAVTKGLDPNIEMEDSGIEWIGMKPEHWKIKRGKDVCEVNGRIGFRGYKTEDLVDEGKGALVLGASHITSDFKIDLSEPTFLSWEKYYESPEIMITQGDVLIVQRGSVGKIGIIEDAIGPATINPSMVLLKPFRDTHPKYLYYFLQSDYIRSFIDILTSSTAVPMISQEQIETFKILFPPLEEQVQIAKFIDHRLYSLDTLIHNLEQQTQQLTEYRKIIIHRAVTGKIKVASAEYGKEESDLIRYYA
jgi:type I restriction enzyme S subunit